MPKTWEPAHVGANLSEENASRQFPYAWNAGQDRNQFAKGGEVGLDLLIDFGDGPVQRIDLLKMEAQQEAMMPRYTASQSLPKTAGEALIRLLARPASRSGSVSPAISASIMARPLAPMTSEMTESSLMLASSSVLCRRCTWLVRSRVNCLRVRSNPRCSCVWTSGTKLARISP